MICFALAAAVHEVVRTVPTIVVGRYTVQYVVSAGKRKPNSFGFST